MKDSVTRAELEGLRPDTGRMEGLETTGRVRGVIVTLLSQDSNYHFFSRYFAPWYIYIVLSASPSVCPD